MKIPGLLLLSSALFPGLFAAAVLLPARRSTARWCFAAGMFLLALEEGFGYATSRASSPAEIQLWQTLALVTGSFLPVTWLGFSLIYSRGNYREFLSRWGGILFCAGVLPLALAGAFWWQPELLRIFASETTGSWRIVFSQPVKILNGLFLTAFVLILMNFERTFRAAVGTMQWRIKFLVLGLAVIFGARIYTRTQALLYSGYDPEILQVDAAGLVIGCFLMVIGYVRAGFSEIDVYPSRTVLHTSFTVLLAGGYLFAVGVLAQVVARRGEAGNFQLQALLLLAGVAVLAVWLLSNRARQATQAFISLHFKRPQHDFRNVWDLFTQSVSGRTDERGICSASAKIVSTTFNALSVSIWLFAEKGDRLALAASTLRRPNESADLFMAIEMPMAAGGASSYPSEPFDLDKSQAAWAESLRQGSTAQFRTGGNRLCVALHARDRSLGFLVLADRVNGRAYTSEELDLLQCCADQMATALLNARLTTEVLAAKELEAFRAMSAFFVHDLKNVASTLGLMLQNLPLHFDDPAFRDDALRGIEKTVNRMNSLIRRLSAFRQKLEIQTSSVDLNGLVDEAVQNTGFPAGVELIRKLNSVPEIVGDRNQLESVIVNLLMNAMDAVHANGTVTIETGSEPGWAAISVSDNGCGMSEEFIGGSLFRPFQSTKTNGLGIGMFQSKIIAEAHRGTIRVTSKVGVGTTIRLILPLNAP